LLKILQICLAKSQERQSATGTLKNGRVEGVSQSTFIEKGILDFHSSHLLKARRWRTGYTKFRTWDHSFMRPHC
jgi:hypothetical protein